MTITIMIIIMISATTFQNITEKLEKKTYFVFTILEILLQPMMLHATHGYREML